MASTGSSRPGLRRRLALAGCAAVCAVSLGACGGGAPAGRSRAVAAHPASRPRHRAVAASLASLAYRPLFSLPAPVQDPAAAPLPAGRFVLLGGLTAADTSTDEVVVAGLDGTTGLGGTAGHAVLPNAQHDAQAATLGGKVYLFGGGQFSEYDHILAFDPATATVQPAGTLPAPASDVAVAGDGTTAYVIGGFDGTNWLDTILAYRPGSSPQVVGHLPVPLRYAAAAALDGEVLIAGGSTPTGVSDLLLRFDPRTGNVTTLAHLPAGVTHAGAGVLGGTMYLVGGRGAAVADRTASIWAIDPRSGRIRAAGKLPQPLSDAAVVSLGDRLIVAGGATPGGTQASVGELLPRP